ncbi:MAG TPA: ABC transporter substrate-binding protein [Candidatus Polarisedimenticolaceae bacterium]|nr:ABC transporter substrate-binding protein [Candidatus Polarisedimenticolaceae bacterium]
MKRALLAAIVVVLVACSSPKTERGGTLVVGSTTDVDAWNEYVSQQTFALNLLRRVYARLAQEQGDTRDHPPSFEPLLAKSWTTSPDGLTLTFTLRDAMWSDGTPVTAGDVRFTWTAQTSPDVAWTGASFKEHVKDVEVRDAKTVAFHFDRAYPEMLADAVEGGIVPEHVFGKVPFASWRTYDWSQVKIASGPFVLESWRPAEEIVLKRNPRYFDAERPRVDAVAVRVVPDMGNLKTQLLAGTVDLVDGVPPSDAAHLSAGQGITLVAYDNPMFDYIGWNCAKKPFDDPEVRRALTLGIDRQAIVEEVLYGYGRISTGPLLSSWWPADPDQKAWPYDPREAQRLLAAKGYDAAHPLAFELTTNSGNRVREAVSVKIQAQLAKIGVQVTPHSYEMKTFREKNSKGDFDAYVAGWRFGGKLDLKSIFGSTEKPPGGSNVVSYASPEADRILDAIGNASDWQTAKASYAALAKRLHDDQPYTFLYESRRLLAVRDRVHGVKVDVPADPFARIDGIWLAP